MVNRTRISLINAGIIRPASSAARPTASLQCDSRAVEARRHDAMGRKAAKAVAILRSAAQRVGE